MVEQDQIKRLLDKQRNVKVTLGVVMGMLLMFYFFSFATLIDKAPFSLFVVQAVTGTMMAIALFFLNKISFMLVKLLFARKQESKAITQQLRSNDVDAKPEDVYKRLGATG